MQLDIFSKDDDDIIIESPIMQHILESIGKIAKSNANVFISGESGTGKEVIAKIIHNLSKRRSDPFIKVNCAALPDTLIESEFFGHEKGAFTGALCKRLGRFELADKGTLLLDEISEVPMHLQAKLLRVVQEQEFERLGGMIPIKVNVRLISTSNRNMKESIEEKQFREDLYYRLNVVPIHLPPLRERREDIIPLARHFLAQFAKKSDIPLSKLSPAAEKKLLSYHFPGNIRELSNLMEQLLVMAGGDIITEDSLQFEPPLSKNALTLAGLSLKELEKQHILETLKTTHFNRTKAAEVLGISTRTLRNKLKIYKDIDIMS